MTTSEKNLLQRDLESIVLRLHNAGLSVQAEQARSIRNSIGWLAETEDRDLSPEASINEYQLTRKARRGK